MAISIQSSRDNADDKTVFFTIGYKSTDYKWHGDIPLNADPQEFLDAKSDTLKTEILRKQYSDAVVPQLEDKSALESFEAWITTGCKNAEVKGEDREGNEYVITPETVIEKTEWVDSHE
jgi:hypothetical protein